MKNILLIILVCVLLGFNNSTESVAYKIDHKSTLRVNGTSNVKGFKCEYDITHFNAPIPIQYSVENDKIKFTKSALVLDNVNFDCGGRAINSDFHEILKTNTYNQIKLVLQEVDLLNTTNGVQVTVDIFMAGVYNTYTIPVSFKGTDTIEVSGRLKMCLDDFNIETPTKLFGLVQIGNHVEIEFDLFLKEV